MGDVLIPSLMTGDCNDSICVRASRFWEFYDLNEETKLLHADLVLIDEEVQIIFSLFVFLQQCVL
jgi:replication factor A1